MKNEIKEMLKNYKDDNCHELHKLLSEEEVLTEVEDDVNKFFVRWHGRTYLLIVSLTTLFEFLNDNKEIDFNDMKVKITLKEEEFTFKGSKEELSKIKLVFSRDQYYTELISFGKYFMGDEESLSIMMENDDYMYVIESETVEEYDCLMGYSFYLRRLEKIKNLNSSIDELLKNTKEEK